VALTGSQITRGANALPEELAFVVETARILEAVRALEPHRQAPALAGQRREQGILCAQAHAHRQDILPGGLFHPFHGKVEAQVIAMANRQTNHPALNREIGGLQFLRQFRLENFTDPPCAPSEAQAQKQQPAPAGSPQHGQERHPTQPHPPRRQHGKLLYNQNARKKSERSHNDTATINALRRSMAGRFFHANVGISQEIPAHQGVVARMANLARLRGTFPRS
jgi:hypothetical protein